MFKATPSLATLLFCGGLAVAGISCGDSTAGATACVAAGASCAAVGDCGVGVGLLGTEDCGAEDYVCCYPLTACPTPAIGVSAEQNFGVCCAGTASYRPVFANGKLSCTNSNPQSTCTQLNATDSAGVLQCPSGSVQLSAVACPLNLTAADSCQ